MEKETKEIKTKKTNKVLLILVIIFGIALVALTTFVTTILFVNPNTKTNETTETTEKEEVKNVLKEIKDIDVITDLSTKIDTILTTKTKQYYKSHQAAAYRYRYCILKGDLSPETKQLILVDTADWEKIPLTDYDKLRQTEFYKSYNQIYGESFVLEETKQVQLEKISKASEKLFGEKFTSSVKNILKCSPYSYEELTKTYYMISPPCGGLNSDKIYSYKSKFEEKDNEAYVYVSFGYASPTSYEPTTERYAIYKDFDIEGELKYNNIKYKNIYQENLGTYNVEHFEINSTNYQDFSEYRFTFKKDTNNNYYFVKVDQTK